MIVIISSVYRNLPLFFLVCFSTFKLS